jgi:hypothetical protein
MSNLSNMRPVYISPWRNGTVAKPSKVRRCICVAVRSANTLAVKALLCAQSDFITSRASLTRVGRINEDRCDTKLGRLVGDDAPQLSERPAVQSRPQPLARFDAATDVGQVFHRNGSRADPQGFGNDLLARHVVDVPHLPPLLNGGIRHGIF